MTKKEIEIELIAYQNGDISKRKLIEIIADALDK